MDLSANQPAPTPPTNHNNKRECAESVLDFLLIELVNSYRRQTSGPPPPAALEAIGFRIGRQLAERLSMHRPRPHDTLELIKFICREFWMDVFKKQIDNLKTNHRGTYVLTDNKFRWIAKVSPDGATPDARQAMSDWLTDALVLPCALLRGALAALRMKATVSAESTHPPSVVFTLRLETEPIHPLAALSGVSVKR